jgi:manganese-dependent ADP-ribose/CDP-alcohol diphosphatase
MLSRRQFLAATLAFPFIARGATRPALHLGLIADPQYADIDPYLTRYYRQSIGKLGVAVEHFNGLELDLCINAGDTIDRSWGSFDEVLKAIGRCKHKFNYVLGNHDFDLLDEFKEKVAPRLEMGGRFYVIQRGGFRFLMADTNDISTYAWPKDSVKAVASTNELLRVAATRIPNAQPWNGAVGPHQLTWLHDQCRAAAAEKQKVIIFAHHPILPAWHNHNTWNSQELLQLVDRNPNVVAWINGHNHAGAYAERNGVPYITLRGMVETEKTNAFSTLQLFDDRMLLTGHGREISREIPFRPAA